MNMNYNLIEQRYMEKNTYTILTILFIGLLSLNVNAAKLSPQIREVDTDNSKDYNKMLYKWKKNFLNIEIIDDTKKAEDSPRVISDKTGKVMSIAGDEIYVNKLANINFYKSMAAYRIGEPIRDADNKKKILGFPFYYLSDLSLVKHNVENDLSLVKVTSSDREVVIGDRILNKSKNKITKVRKNKNKISAKVLKVINGVNIANVGDSIILNVGKNSRLREGDLLKITRNVSIKQSVQLHEDKFFTPDHFLREKRDPNRAKKVKLPDENIATILVYRVFDKSSVALVIEAKKPVETKYDVVSFDGFDNHDRHTS